MREEGFIRRVHEQYYYPYIKESVPDFHRSLKYFENHKDLSEIVEWLNTEVDDYYAKLGHTEDGLLTLCHGDFHIGNTMLEPKSDAVERPRTAFLDMAMYAAGNGMLDVQMLLLFEIQT